MLPHSIVALIISLLVIVGAGTLLYILNSKKAEGSNKALAPYALLIFLGILHTIGAGISFIISVYFLIKGNLSEKLAGGAFIVVAAIIYLLSHAFLLFRL